MYIMSTNSLNNNYSFFFNDYDTKDTIYENFAKMF